MKKFRKCKQTHIKWKIMTLEKFRRKNHQISSSYEEKILVTKFNSGLKRENELYLCSSSHLTWSNKGKNGMLKIIKTIDGVLVRLLHLWRKVAGSSPSSSTWLFFSTLLQPSSETIIYKSIYCPWHSQTKVWRTGRALGSCLGDSGSNPQLRLPFCSN